MQEIASIQGEAISQQTRLLCIWKVERLDDEILNSQKTGNLETLSLPVVLLSIKQQSPIS